MNPFDDINNNSHSHSHSHSHSLGVGSFEHSRDFFLVRTMIRTQGQSQSRLP